MAKSPPKVKRRLKPPAPDADSQALSEFQHLWHEYGKSAVTGLVLAVAAVAGWQGWDYYRDQDAIAAAESYIAFVETLGLDDTAPEDVDATPEDADTAPEDADAAPEDADTAPEDAAAEVEVPELPEALHADTPYPTFARLQRAKYLVKHNLLSEAAEDLYWVGENAVQPMLSQLAYFRLVRVLIAGGQTEEALEVLDGTEFANAMTPLVEEARGDALLQNKDTRGAIDAYKRAWEASPQKPAFLRMKLESLGQNVAARPPPSAAQ